MVDNWLGRLLTYGGDHSGGEHSRAGELPEAVSSVVAPKAESHPGCIMDHLQNKPQHQVRADSNTLPEPRST